MTLARRLVAVLAASVPAATLPAAPVQQQPPAIRSGVELVMVDVHVVDRKGLPVPSLRPDQFEVQIDGKRRSIVSAQLIEASTGLAQPAGGDGAAAAPADSTPIQPGNVYVLAIDQGSFRAVNAPSAMHAVREFVKRLNPNDYLGLISFPGPGATIDPTRDRETVLAAVPGILGFTSIRQPRRFQYSLSDAVDVSSRDAEARRRVIERACQPNDMACPVEVELELNEVATNLEAQGVRSFDGLRGAVTTAASVPGRKTLVVVSAGIPSGDRTGGRVYLKSDALNVGKLAAESGMLVYTLHLNSRFLDAFSPDAPSVSQTLLREEGVYARGLELFNGSAGGTFLDVTTGPDFAIDRVIRETSKYYLLGVEPEAADRDGKPHQIRVRVKQGGTNVRNRPMVVIPKPGTQAGRTTPRPISTTRE
jgi:VWFA-related protein